MVNTESRLWWSGEGDDDCVHVIPLDDLKPHVEQGDCDCRPERVSDYARDLFVHNSYDGRELN
jgi:hypothetical protein